MLKVRLSMLAIAGLSVIVASSAPAISLQEDFSSDPSARGWKIFGNTNLFHWDSTHHNLDVTWDSREPNSYFYLPLGTVVGRDDDFSFAFDLRLSAATTGDTTGPLQMALGFLNLADATGADFIRGLGMSPNVVEFDYYPSGYFPGYASSSAAVPSFVDRTSSAFAPGYVSPYYALELPSNLVMRVAMSFTASNQTAVLEVTTNGVPLAQLPGLALNISTNSGFSDTNDFRLTMFSITSYSEAGQFPPWVGSILAHGTVDNMVLTVPPPPVSNLTGCLSNGVWQVRFDNRTNWLYTLECSTDLLSWTNVSRAADGNGALLFLEDTNALVDKGFYRVRANRP
jgi:hypothetical protein